MRKFTTEEIQELTDHFVDKDYPVVKKEIGGRNITYFILPASLKKELPNYVVRATGDPKYGYFIGVSQGMPEEFQPYAVLEEYIEFMEKGIDAPNRVVEAESEVIAIMPEALRRGYVKMRREFFVTLLENNEKDPETYQFSSDDVVEFRKNLEMLEELVRHYER